MSNKKPSHQRCQALSRDEHNFVCSLLPPRCVAQAMAVVQVYSTWEPNFNVWHKMGTGVAIFNKDSERRGFFIQVYDYDAEDMLFEQEIYREFEYHSSTAFFHQFEAENKMIGLNFSNDADAVSFNNAVTTLLINRRRKREEKSRKAINEQKAKLAARPKSATTQLKPQPPQPQLLQPPQQPRRASSTESIPSITKKGKGILGTFTLREKKKKVRRELEIGEPFNFEHISHAGFDSNFNVDAELIGLFEAVGLDQSKLSNTETRDFVYDFLEKHKGGMEEARRFSRKVRDAKHTPHSSVPSHPHHAPPPPSVTERKPPTPPERRKAPQPTIPSEPTYPPPSKQPPPPPARGPAPKPPPQSSRPLNQYTVPPPPPLNPPRTTKRPSPPSSTPAPAQHHRKPETIQPTPKVPSSSSSVPPPPPPPPPLPTSIPPPPPLPTGVTPPPPPPPLPSSSSGAPRPPPVPASSSSSSSDPRTALLSQIRQGKELKKAPVMPSEPKPPDSRNALLSEIRNREFKLHHVDTSETDSGRNSVSEPAGLEGIALDLHRALQERAHFIQADDEEEEDDSDDIDYDEWDDDD